MQRPPARRATQLQAPKGGRKVRQERISRLGVAEHVRRLLAYLAILDTSSVYRQIRTPNLDQALEANSRRPKE